MEDNNSLASRILPSKPPYQRIHDQPQTASLKLTSVNKTSIAPRCYMCHGFGHTANQCLTKQKHCGKCGSIAHLSKQCFLTTTRSLGSVIQEEVAENPDDDMAPMPCDSSLQDISEEPTEVSYGLMAIPLNPTSPDLHISDMEGHFTSAVHENISLLRQCLASKKTLTLLPKSHEPNVSHICDSQCVDVIIYSGASRHITGNKKLLDNLRPASFKVMSTFNRQEVGTSVGSLTFQFTTSAKPTLTMTDVIYCKHVPATILSVKQMILDAEFFVVLNSRCCSIPQ